MLDCHLSTCCADAVELVASRPPSIRRQHGRKCGKVSGGCIWLKHCYAETICCFCQPFRQQQANAKVKH